MDEIKRIQLYIFGLMLKLSETNTDGGLLALEKIDRIREAMGLNYSPFSAVLEKLREDRLLTTDHYYNLKGFRLTAKGIEIATEETDPDFIPADIDYDEIVRKGRYEAGSVRVKVGVGNAHAGDPTAHAGNIEAGSRMEPSPSAASAIDDSLSLGDGQPIPIVEAGLPRAGIPMQTVSVEVNSTSTERIEPSRFARLVVQRGEILSQSTALLAITDQFLHAIPKIPNDPETVAEREFLETLRPFIVEVQDWLNQPGHSEDDADNFGRQILEQLQASLLEIVKNKEATFGVLRGSTSALFFLAISMVAGPVAGVIGGTVATVAAFPQTAGAIKKALGGLKGIVNISFGSGTDTS